MRQFSWGQFHQTVFAKKNFTDAISPTIKTLNLCAKFNHRNLCPICQSCALFAKFVWQKMGKNVDEFNPLWKM